MAKPPKVSEEAKGFLDEANGASDPAWSAWLAFLAASDLRGGHARHP